MIGVHSLFVTTTSCAGRSISEVFSGLVGVGVTEIETDLSLICLKVTSTFRCVQ